MQRLQGVDKGFDHQACPSYVGRRGNTPIFGHHAEDTTMRIWASIWFLAGSTCLASTHYVSPTGNDSWPGTSAQPWGTPGYGSKHMAGGDTLIILSGDYVMSVFWDDMLTPPSGSEGALTVVAGQGPTTPRLLGTGSLYSCAAVDDGAYLELRNLEFTSFIDSPYTGGTRGGVSAAGAVNHLRFVDLEIHRVEDMGINLGGDAEEILVKRCSIHHNAYTALGGPSATGDGWVSVVIDSCSLSYGGHFYDGQDQLSPWDRPDGLGFEASEGPVEVRYTIAEHNLGDGLDSKSKRTHIHHCIVANNFGDGVKLWGDSSRVENTLIYGTGDGDATASPWCLLVIGTDDMNAYFELTNVTMWDSPNRHPHYTASVQYDDSAIPATLVMRNVIVSGLRQFYVSPIVTVSADHNLFDIDAQEQIYANGIEYTCATIGGLGIGNRCGDPQFVAPAWGTTGDFHPQESSPAVDTGIETPLVDDLDLFPRPCNAVWDRGCYEYHPPCYSFPLGPELVTLPVPAPWPNPASGCTRIATAGLGVSATRLVMVDLAGRRIHPPTNACGASGVAELLVNLRQVPPGVYAVALESRSHPAWVPLVVLP